MIWLLDLLFGVADRVAKRQLEAERRREETIRIRMDAFRKEMEDAEKRKAGQ